MFHTQEASDDTDVGEEPPEVTIKKLAIVSRDYNNRRDFNDVLRKILHIAEHYECDAVLFALYTIAYQSDDENVSQLDKIKSILDRLNLKHVEVVFIELFRGRRKRIADWNVAYYKTKEGWRTYRVRQSFGSMKNTSKKKIGNFVKELPDKRILGNCCWLICGETNGVRYSKHDGMVEIIDTHGLHKAIPPDVTLIINPVHDRMTRFEMPRKRQFLSQNRWVVSVWNKGRKGSDGRTRDGGEPAWQVYHNREEVPVAPIESGLQDIEIGILKLT